ncbi:MAG: molybdenum cofactor guanylyltransferase [Flavobacteriales bacterium]|nr:molybdenum cofactor guanylyltransferase [Flavobacteriales bacterium]
MINYRYDITGFVLAGGKSSRMGRDKALIPLHGTSMIEYATRSLLPVCSTVAIIAGNDRYRELGYPVYADVVPDSGPLAGICTGLAVSDSPLNIFVCCDSPFVTPEFWSFLLDRTGGCDAVVPRSGDVLYPLTAVYKKSCLPVFRERLDTGKLKVREAIRCVRTNEIDMPRDFSSFDDKMLANFNTPLELGKFLKP